MSKQYLIMSLIIYSNISELNGGFLKVSDQQNMQSAFITEKPAGKKKERIINS
jgi:hypothetical protein